MNPITAQKWDDYIREFMFKWIGVAGERICNKLIELSALLHNSEICQFSMLECPDLVIYEQI